MKEMELLKSRTLRDKMSGMHEILGEVKELFSLPDTEFMSFDQIADYYEVTPNRIKELYGNHKDEIDSDGTKVLPKLFYEGRTLEYTSDIKHTKVTYFLTTDSQLLLTTEV